MNKYNFRFKEKSKEKNVKIILHEEDIRIEQAKDILRRNDIVFYSRINERIFFSPIYISVLALDLIHLYCTLLSAFNCLSAIRFPFKHFERLSICKCSLISWSTIINNANTTSTILTIPFSL